MLVHGKLMDHSKSMQTVYILGMNCCMVCKKITADIKRKTSKFNFALAPGLRNKKLEILILS